MPPIARVIARSTPAGLDPAVRLNPAVLEVSVPSPAQAAVPFQRPRLWHTLHRNNLARMLALAGWEEVGYELHGGGEGATIVYESLAPDATPGLLPQPVQDYVEEFFGKDCWDLARTFIGTLRKVLPLIGALFPQAGPALAITTTVAGVAETVVDTLDDE